MYTTVVLPAFKRRQKHTVSSAPCLISFSRLTSLVSSRTFGHNSFWKQNTIYHNPVKVSDPMSWSSSSPHRPSVHLMLQILSQEGIWISMCYPPPAPPILLSAVHLAFPSSSSVLPLSPPLRLPSPFVFGSGDTFLSCAPWSLACA